MFDITFYKNESPANFVNKNLTLNHTMQGTLREGTSLIDPILIVEANGPGFQANGYNYVWVPDFKRYYYITNIVSTYYKMWEIHCHVDVLMSYKEDILKQTAIVSRQENIYNLYLDDGTFMSYQNPKIQTKVFSNATPFETQEFVLIVAGS